MRQLSATDRQLIETLRKAVEKGSTDAAELADRTGIPVRTVQRALADLIEDGKVVRQPPTRGRIYHPDFAPVIHGGRQRPAKAARRRPQAGNRPRETEGQSKWEWAVANPEKVALAAAGIGAMLTPLAAVIARPDQVQRHETSMLRNAAMVSRDVIERVLAGARIAHLQRLAPEDPDERRRKEQALANQVMDRELQLLEDRRRQLTAVIYRPLQQQVLYLEALGVLVPVDDGSGLGLVRRWEPNPDHFPFDLLPEFARPGGLIYRESIGPLLSALLRQVEASIAAYGVAPMPRPGPPPYQPPAQAATRNTTRKALPAAPPRRSRQPQAHVVTDPAGGYSVLMPGTAPRPARDAEPVRTFLSGYLRLTLFSDGSIRPEQG